MRDYLAGLIMSHLRKEKPQSIPSNIDVYEIIEISARNQMDYLVLGSLIQADNVPEEALGIIRARLQKSIMRTLVQVSELKKIVESFEVAGIKNQPMKGSCMKYMYPTPEMREMSDIDILIDADRMQEAGKKLTELGYKKYSEAVHHDEYSKPPYMIVEAHCAMYDKNADAGQYNYFKSFSRATLCEGMKYTYEFNINDFYVYMLAHMAKHFYLAGCGVRNLVDIYVYLEKYGTQLDRAYIKKELEKCGIYDFSQHVEELAYTWLEGRKSTPFLDDLFQYMLDCGLFGKQENALWHKFAKNKNNKKVTKLQLKRMYYFPSVAYLSEDYPWLERLPFLLPLAWVIRFVKRETRKADGDDSKGQTRLKMVTSVDMKKANTYQDIYRKMNLKFKK